MANANTEQAAQESAATNPTWIAQERLTPYNATKEIPEWKVKRSRIMNREAPVFILMTAALAWALMNVLFLGFTATEIVVMKSLALSMGGVGVVWLMVSLWDYLHRVRE